MTFARQLISPQVRSRKWLWLSPLAAAAAITIVLMLPSRRNPASEELVRGNESEPSAVVAAIRVVAPINGAVITNTPTFVWQSLPGQSLFRFTLTSADGTEVWSAETSDTSITVPPNVTLGPRAYLWLVDALDSEGHSVTSGTQQFRLTR